MLDKPSLIKTLNAYNLLSNNYGSTIYEENGKLGICLDIKHPIFGFLTRVFTFDTTSSLEEFLNKYIWYKNNYQKYNINLIFDSYETKSPNLKYNYNDYELTLEEMLNLKNTIEHEKKSINENNEKSIYILNIQNLTNYLINLKNAKQTARSEKNNLKIKENDLKYTLLEALTTYYGKNSIIDKKAVSLDSILNYTDNSNLKNNLVNIENKSLAEIKDYLLNLINTVKQEELDENYLINLYSNNIYKYNIEILNKQIEFVKNKIEAEKNFNIKGSKIHNIDEELKSFLRTATSPIKIETYLKETKEKILNKYNSITNITNAYSIISGNNITIPKKEVKDLEVIPKINDILTNLFNSLTKEIKSNLILYNSFYKNICNFIIDNNFPSIDIIKNNFDFTYYYNTIDEIIHNENNNHYLINYFNTINFKTLDTYIESLINISKTLTTTVFTAPIEFQAFTLNRNNIYKEYSLTPIYQNNTYLVDIKANTKIIYIPIKIDLDDITNEISIINTNNIYTKGIVNSKNTSLTINKYSKKNIKDENNLMITTDLTLKSSTTFNLGTLEEQL